MEKFAIGLMLGAIGGALVAANSCKMRMLVRKGQEEIKQRLDEMMNEKLKELEKGGNLFSSDSEKRRSRKTRTRRKRARNRRNKNCLFKENSAAVFAAEFFVPVFASDKPERAEKRARNKLERAEKRISGQVAKNE